MVILTDIGDSAVLLPLAMATVLYLGLAGWRRGAVVFAAGVAGTGVAMAALKVAFLACGDPAAALHLRSPSGHTALSTIVFGLLTWILAPRLGGLAARAMTALGLFLILAVAIGRVLLGFHSWAEVALGGAVALAVLALCVLALPRRLGPPLKTRTFAAACLVLTVSLHGLRLPAEHFLREIAGVVGGNFNHCRAPVAGDAVFPRMAQSRADFR